MGIKNVEKKCKTIPKIRGIKEALESLALFGRGEGEKLDSSWYIVSQNQKT